MKPACLTAVLMSAALVMPALVSAQAVDEDQLGAWYMYFYDVRFEDSRFGLQGDGQWRNWDLGGDLEQLLLRSGATFTPEDSNTTFTFGYASITSGSFGPSDASQHEHRIYQEALIRQRVGSRVRLRHRLRTEQRFVEDQDFRTRFRYALFVDIPLNRREMNPGAYYLALYDEVFINLERNIGDGRRVDRVDRNRLYGALGYVVTSTLKVQGGVMLQSSGSIDKPQLQLSLHQAFR
ncbi:MAG: DUF2490 domain-containing protein [Pseudomonadota bacterium]